MASSSHGYSPRKTFRKRSIEEPQPLYLLPAPKSPRKEMLALPAPPVRRKHGLSEPADESFELNILLPDGSNIVLYEERDDELGVDELLRKVRRQFTREGRESSIVKWGPHVYLEDGAGNIIQAGQIFDCEDPKRILILQDGQPHGIHSLQDMWNVTPDPELLGSLPQEYTLETALADLLDNSLQAVWANLPGEKRLISVTLRKDKIIIFDSGQGMDSTSENSIAKWGTMGSSKHRSVRVCAIGGKPPFLRPYFGMYGFGGLIAAMHLGGVAVVSSKTKSSKKVVALTLEKDKLMERCRTDRTWKTPGEYREPTEEEMRRSPHGSFTKVELSKLKKEVWTEMQVMCMLKDIYFPYIQCDAADTFQRTTTPVEFEVNDTNLAEVDGGEVAVTNMSSCNGSPFVIDIHMKKINQNTDPDSVNDLDRANARIKCFYFPIQQGKESIDHILEELQNKDFGINETFDNFCRVSIRRLGRLLPDARWGRLPFMEPRRKRGDKASVPKICFERVKAFVDTDAGFVPTTSKMDLLTGHAFTSFLRNLGTRGNLPEVVTFEIFRGSKQLKLQDLEKEYEDWIKDMHGLFDEEVECLDEPDFIVTEQLKELGFSQEVYRIYSKMNRKGVVWKRKMRIKFSKGLPGHKNKDFFATLEYFLADGLSEDKGNTKVICRPMEIPKVEGSRLIFGDASIGFELGRSKVIPIDFLTLDKCEILNETDWTRIYHNKHLHEPGEIDILEKKIIQRLGLDGGISPVVKAGVKPFYHIYAVVRPNIYMKQAQEGKSLNPVDQKNIVKKSMQMKLQLRRLNGLYPHSSENTDDEEFEMDISMVVSEKSINNLHGFYCFNIEQGDFGRFYTKAGKYALTFSVMDEGNSDGMLEKTLEVSIFPSDKVGKWILQTMDGPGTPIVRLGSEIGPLLVHCLDEYNNVKDVDKPHDLRFEVWSGERKLDLHFLVDRILQEKTSTSFIVKAVKLAGGLLTGIAVDHSALLKLVISNKPVASMEINVLPGEMKRIREVPVKDIDNCLRTGDIIHSLTLQVMDGYGNHVEKGCKVVLHLDNLELQDDQCHDRMVDDEGCINLGGLLKVTGKFNAKASICVYSENENLLYKREFALLKRALQVVSKIPKDYAAGGVLQDLTVQIVDEEGNVDKTMTGSQHLIILSSYDERVYPLKEGSCCIKSIQLPDQPGPWHCQIYHMTNKELEKQIEINLLPTCQHLNDVLDFGDNDKCPTLFLHDKTSLQKDLERLGESVIARLEDLKTKMGIYCKKVKQGEDEFEKLTAIKKVEMDTISRLEGDIESLQTQAQNVEEGSAIDSQDRHDITAERIAQEISKTCLPAKFFLEAFCSGSFLSVEAGNHSIPNILGVVCLLASTKHEALSQALAEFIGQESMLAVVCKTHEAAGLLIRLNQVDATIDETWGLYKFIKGQNRDVHGKLRIFILEDLRCYNKGHDENHPQKLLNMEKPKLNNGEVPNGFIGYAVNLLHLNEEHPDVTSGDHTGLRGTLFYSLLKELQVYDTQKNLFNAKDALTTGGISLDGGLIRERGCEDFGQREKLKIVFPLYSKARKRIPSLRSINHISKSMQIRDSIKGKKQELEVSRERLVELEGRVRYVKKSIRSREEKFEATKQEMEKQRQELSRLEDNIRNL